MRLLVLVEAAAGCGCAGADGVDATVREGVGVGGGEGACVLGGVGGGAGVAAGGRGGEGVRVASGVTGEGDSGAGCSAVGGAGELICCGCCGVAGCRTESGGVCGCFAGIDRVTVLSASGVWTLRLCCSGCVIVDEGDSSVVVEGSCSGGVELGISIRGFGVQPNGTKLRGSRLSILRGTTIPLLRRTRIWSVPGMGPMQTAISDLAIFFRFTLW